MSAAVEGLFATEIYVTDDGFLAIEQANNVVVLLTADQIVPVMTKLRAYYDARAMWQEPKPG
jgi:hypothetical protein